MSLCWLFRSSLSNSYESIAPSVPIPIYTCRFQEIIFIRNISASSPCLCLPSAIDPSIIFLFFRTLLVPRRANSGRRYGWTCSRCSVLYLEEPILDVHTVEPVLGVLYCTSLVRDWQLCRRHYCLWGDDFVLHILIIYDFPILLFLRYIIHYTVPLPARILRCNVISCVSRRLKSSFLFKASLPYTKYFPNSNTANETKAELWSLNSLAIPSPTYLKPLCTYNSTGHRSQAHREMLWS